MEDISTIGIIATVVTAVIGFLIGKSGVLTRIFDTRIRRIENNQQKESNMIEDAIKENKDLREEVATLSKKVIELESQVKEYKHSMSLIVEYLKKLDVTDPFIDKLVK